MEFRDPGAIQNPAAALLRDLIHERTGIFFSDGQMDLFVDKVSGLLAEHGSDSLLDYYYRLKYDDDQEEWTNVLDAISVRETFFWREFDQTRALVDVVLPRLAEERRGPIKIWSAACASGEEPLTIAMALEVAGWFDRIPIEINASDGSEAALLAAKRGIYRERSFRSFPAEYRDRFFVPADGNWKIKPDIHQRIRWHRVNLADEYAVAKLAQAPVIFCRNVFIYFSAARILKTAKVFEQNMCRPGYLFLGASESLLKFDTGFELHEIGGAFVYVRK